MDTGFALGSCARKRGGLLGHRNSGRQRSGLYPLRQPPVPSGPARRAGGVPKGLGVFLPWWDCSMPSSPAYPCDPSPRGPIREWRFTWYWWWPQPAKASFVDNTSLNEPGSFGYLITRATNTIRDIGKRTVRSWFDRLTMSGLHRCVWIIEWPCNEHVDFIIKTCY